MNWYYSLEGRAIGPVNEQALEELAQVGAVARDTLVWQSGMEVWDTLQHCRPDLLERIRKQKQTPAPEQPQTSEVPPPSAPPPTREKSGGLFGRFFGR